MVTIAPSGEAYEWRRRERALSSVTHRERVLAALSHREADRVPLDLGSHNASKIHRVAYRRLLAHLGWPEEPEERDEAGLQKHYLSAGEMARPSEALLELLDVDFRSVSLSAPDEAAAAWLDGSRFVDEWGVVWARAGEGEFINKDGPFQQLEEPGLADLERHEWPDPDDPGRYRGMREAALAVREQTDYALVLDLDLGIVNKCQRVRGFCEWLEDLPLRPAFAEGLLARVLDVEAGIARRALAEVGDLADVVVFYDDLGFQDRCYMHPKLYRRLVKPYHAGLVAAIKGASPAKVLLHSDGSIHELLGDLVEIGIDAINPVQTTAAGMDSRELKREFGEQLAFWGAIDTQRVLPFGTQEDVGREVRQRIDHLGAGGGYVLAACHNIQADVPPENVLAMFEAAKRLRRASVE